MSNLLYLIPALIAGSVLGYGYFYGLWWTVRQMTTRRDPYRVLLLSFVIRSLAVMGGFYLLLLSGWPMLATGLLGFILTRFFVVRKWGLADLNTNQTLEKTDGI
ncbi:ATP synthase subunit I [Halalkalibaculum sp. DA3122]|uniref:N-ATPase subunit AtpR n=1 Tax=unclassified Halalkalibaculum TaxID=2964617 RepID=UPI003754A17D